MPLEIIQIPALNDNYNYLLHDRATGKTAAVDPSEAEPTRRALEQRGWGLDIILNTHHHGDHVGGNLALQQQYGCAIYGYAADAARIPGITRRLDDEETITVGESVAQVLFVPGHTRGHIAYYFADDGALFCGDTLFGMGCGRLFEGTPQQMHASLRRLQALPEGTLVYCAHEYTEANGRFALTLEPQNPHLQQRMVEVRALRRQGRPTVPSTLAEEKRTNPFLREDSPEIRRVLAMEDAPSASVFAEIRRRKDVF